MNSGEKSMATVNQDKKRNTIDIQGRTFAFACRIIRLYKTLVTEDRSNEILCRQLVRSGTSVGANLEEAAGAQSRADFLSKCNIALKEARESYYWLRLLTETEIVAKQKINSLLNEANEIVCILTSIVKNTRKNTPKKDC